MPTIALINSKGGVGKTTIALNLGLFLSQNNYEVVFVDLDRQQSLSDWLKRRPKALTQFECIKSSCNKLTSEVFESKNANTVFILDTPASVENSDITHLLNFSDCLLIPISPSPIDLGALTRFIFQLAVNDEEFLKNMPIGVLSNRSKTYTSVHREVINKVKKLNIPLIATFRDTQNYTLPSTRGMGLIELPGYKIKKDLDAWNALLQWLDSSDISLLSEST